MPNESHFQTLEQAASLYHSGNIELAYALVSPLATALTNKHAGGYNESNDEAVYYDFADGVSGFVYLALMRESRKVRAVTEPFARTYALAGLCLMQMGRYAESVEMFNRAVDWDPSSPSLRLNLAEACRAMGNIDGFDNCIKGAYPLITTNEDLALFHACKGLYLLTADKVDLAIASLQVSNHLQRSEFVAGHLLELTARYGAARVDIDEPTALGLLRAAGEPVIPPEITVKLLVECAEAAEKGGFDPIAYESLRRASLWIDSDEVAARRDAAKAKLDAQDDSAEA